MDPKIIPKATTLERVIRYVIREALDSLVSASQPTWRQRANDATAVSAAVGRHVDAGSLWSEIKDVFIRLQRFKCAYCERWIGPSRIEWDVEHFRPKSSVRGWESSMPEIPSCGPASPIGYYLLAFDPANYLASCKTCNTIWKSDAFPVAGNRRVDTADVQLLADERPYLLFPLGSGDENPEDLIYFHGPVPRPVQPSGSRRYRALVTIELFGLAEREELIHERNEIICGIWLALTHPDAQVPGSVPHDALKYLLSDASRHASCARSFARLAASDRQEAERLFEVAKDQLKGHSR